MRLKAGALSCNTSDWQDDRTGVGVTQLPVAFWQMNGESRQVRAHEINRRCSPIVMRLDIRRILQQTLGPIVALTSGAFSYHAAVNVRRKSTLQPR
jgi:hypothetical protein